MTKLTFMTKDVHEIDLDPSLIGMSIRHCGNNRLYQITDYVWMGATDEWGFIAREVTDEATYGIPVARPFSHLYGTRANGEPRYLFLSKPKAGTLAERLLAIADDPAPSETTFKYTSEGKDHD